MTTLRDFVQRAGLTQAELAKLTGIRPETVNRHDLFHSLFYN